MSKIKARLGAWLSLLTAPVALLGLLMADTDGAAGQGAPTDPPAGGPPPDPKSGEGESKTFSQAEVDRIVQERLARAKAKPPADYEDLKAAAAKLAEIEEANSSELEKAQRRATEAEEAAKALKEQHSSYQIDTAIRLAAIEAKAADPGDVVKLLDRDGVTIGDDGQVTGVEDAVKGLLKAKPHLVGQQGPTGDGDGGRRGSSAPGQLTRADVQQLAKSGRHEEIAQARRDGRLNEVLGIT